MYPIIFEFGVITVYSLWLCIAAGFVVGALMFVRLAKRYRVKLGLLSDGSFLLFVWTLGISRLVFILFHHDLYFYQFSFKNITSLLAIWDKGLSFWGAVFAWISGVWYLSFKQKTEHPLRILDITVPALMLGMFFGNIGAWLDGVNYGSPTDLPWGMTFRSANVKYIAAIHPTQLYAAFYTLLLAGGLMLLLKKFRGQLPGVVTEVGLFFFSTFKFLEEFVRGDETVRLFALRLPQLMAFAGMALGAYLLYQRYTNRAGRDPQGIFKKFVKELWPRKSRKPTSQEITAVPSVLQSQGG